MPRLPSVDSHSLDTSKFGSRMADVYLVYASENRGFAEKLHELLSPRWDVWWDDKIVGRFSDAIENEMPRARCAIPFWSSQSRGKDTFTDELRLAQKHSVELLPVRLDDSEPPYGYGAYSHCDLRGWSGEQDHKGLQQLLRRLGLVVPPRGKPKRPPSLASRRIPLPTLFLSVSSYETQLVPSDAVRALRVFGAPAILVSAFDAAAPRKSEPMLEALADYRAQGGFVLLDSGNYEASRRGSRRWKPEALRTALERTPHDWAFCFDVMRPSRLPTKAAEEIVKAVERDQALTSAPVLPIVHAPRDEHNNYMGKAIPGVIRDIAERLQPPLIAIPERELGPGLIARAVAVQAIRAELDKLPFYQPIHLLGTGNPWSIAILAAAGADTFDGLEWCRVAVDRSTDRLHHYQHFDFFTYQTELADSLIARAALEDTGVDFTGKVAFHNLDYFAGFLSGLREAIAEGSLEAFLVGLLGKDNAAQLKRQVKGLFK